MIQIAGVIATQANPTALLNFNGGTLKATVANTAFMTSANVDGVFVYGGGGTIFDRTILFFFYRLFRYWQGQQ